MPFFGSFYVFFLRLFLCVQSFVIFCGLGINNTMMYNQVKKTWAKQSVALDVRPAAYLLQTSFF